MRLFEFAGNFLALSIFSFQLLLIMPPMNLIFVGAGICFGLLQASISESALESFTLVRADAAALFSGCHHRWRSLPQ